VVRDISLVSHPDLSARAYEVIRDAILTGQLAPGSRLNNLELARSLGVSATPVKDALNRLVAERLVAEVTRKGYFVTSFSIRDVAETLDVRLILELTAAERAITLIQPAQMVALGRLASEMERMVEAAGVEGLDVIDFMRRDSAFHALTVSAGGNRHLAEIYAGLNAHLSAVRVVFAAHLATRRGEITLQEHRAIVDAFEARSLPALKLALSAHVQSVARTLARAAEGRGSDGEPQPPGPA